MTFIIWPVVSWPKVPYFVTVHIQRHLCRCHFCQLFVNFVMSTFSTRQDCPALHAGTAWWLTPALSCRWHWPKLFFYFIMCQWQSPPKAFGSLPYSVLNRTRTKSRLCPSPQCKSGVIGVTSTKPTAWYVTHIGAYFCVALIVVRIPDILVLLPVAHKVLKHSKFISPQSQPTIVRSQLRGQLSLESVRVVGTSPDRVVTWPLLRLAEGGRVQTNEPYSSESLTRKTPKRPLFQW